MSGGHDPAFLTLDQVMELHREALIRHGGIDGVRDAGAIESALASAQNTWLYGTGDIYDIAAAYAFHIAECQAFLDGNKRAAVAAAIAFLALNDCVDNGDDSSIYDAMISIAQRRMGKVGLAVLLRKQFVRSE